MTVGTKSLAVTLGPSAPESSYYYVYIGWPTGQGSTLGNWYPSASTGPYVQRRNSIRFNSPLGTSLCQDDQLRASLGLAPRTKRVCERVTHSRHRGCRVEFPMARPSRCICGARNGDQIRAAFQNSTYMRPGYSYGHPVRLRSGLDCRLQPVLRA